MKTKLMTFLRGLLQSGYNLLMVFWNLRKVVRNFGVFQAG